MQEQVAGEKFVSWISLILGTVVADRLLGWDIGPLAILVVSPLVILVFIAGGRVWGAATMRGRLAESEKLGKQVAKEEGEQDA